MYVCMYVCMYVLNTNELNYFDKTLSLCMYVLNTDELNYFRQDLEFIYVCMYMRSRP